MKDYSDRQRHFDIGYHPFYLCYHQHTGRSCTTSITFKHILHLILILKMSYLFYEI